MPGLTLNTGAATAASTSTPIYPPQHPASQQTPVPVPVPAASARNNSNTITNGNGNTTKQPSPSRDSSPQRPPYSPITPPLNPLALPPRPTYTHSAQRDQQAIPPPPPEPIDFDSNPDALALKSAISILQIQRRKAQADMAALSRAKSAALADPEAFVRDLTSGRVAVEGDGLFVGGVRSSGEEAGEEDSSSDEDADMENAESAAAGQQAPPRATAGGEHQPDGNSAGPSSDIKKDPDGMEQPHPPTQPQQPKQEQSQPPQPRAWARLPKPQSVVRCPPINWSQYAVVGESLDKLHAEQQARPSQGVPATVGPDGRYEFKGGQGAGRQERLVGIAAPYTPGKDRLDSSSKKKPKGLKR